MFCCCSQRCWLLCYMAEISLFFHRFKWKQIYSAFFKFPFTIFPRFLQHPRSALIHLKKCILILAEAKQSSSWWIESMKMASSPPSALAAAEAAVTPYLLHRLFQQFYVYEHFSFCFSSVINNLWVFIYWIKCLALVSTTISLRWTTHLRLRKNPWLEITDEVKLKVNNKNNEKNSNRLENGKEMLCSIAFCGWCPKRMNERTNERAHTTPSA